MKVIIKAGSKSFENQGNVHSRFKEHIQAVRALNKFERNADKEEFLELLRCKSTVTKTNGNSCDETATGDNDIEQVPAVCSEAAPPQTKKAHEDIKKVNEHKNQEEVIWKEINIVDRLTESSKIPKLTTQSISQTVCSEGLSPLRIKRE